LRLAATPIIMPQARVLSELSDMRD